MTPDWLLLQKQENQRVALRNIRVLCLIAMAMVPAAVMLDCLAYPHLVQQFFRARAIVAFIEILLLALSYTEGGQRRYRLLMLLVPLVPAMAIAWMIYRSGDPASPYYAGLTLVLVGVGFLYQWSYVESMIAVAITVFLYLAATVPLLGEPWVNSASIGAFINNGIFLLLNSIVIITGSVVHHRIRMNEVVSRYRLADSRRELEEKNRQLVEMDRLKTDFFSNVTHELRTPLTLMLAPLQRLQRLYPADPAQEDGQGGLRSELDGIYQNALRLLKIINDLLDLSSLDAGRLRLERREFSLPQFVSELARSVDTMAQQGGITLQTECRTILGRVCGDEEKIEKILLNLLFNAIKFTPAGGRVVLSVSERGDETAFEVADTGVGIPEGSLPFIFDRFWQADTSVTRHHPGTGLGLSLVREFAERMGGRVEAESAVGKGTILRLMLPRFVGKGGVTLGVFVGADPSQETAAAAEAGGAHAASAAWIRSIYREAEFAQPGGLDPAAGANPGPAAQDDGRADLPLVLVVDDEPGMQRFIRSELEPHYRVLVAGDGAEAVDLAIERRPDLVIADYMMPRLDGLGLCRALRERAATRLLPVMLVTARSDEQVRLTALREGANDVLVKPFSLAEFHSRVRNLLCARLLQKELESRNLQLEQTLAELRAAERELIQSEKMAALGILTGGIIHEINNPLNFARSALFVLDRRTACIPAGAAADIGGIVADLREGISRITHIVSDLRTFCHPESLMASSCNIMEPLQGALRLLNAPLKDASVRVEERVSPSLAVRGDKNRLLLVFMNLFKNAIDALAADPPSGGVPPQIEVSAQPAASGAVEVRFRDNGPGIDAGNLARVFDPFFTTKAPGEGTGLGLAICYRIVAAHGGSIRVQSQPAGGTEFVISLPAADASSDAQPGATALAA